MALAARMEMVDCADLAGHTTLRCGAAGFVASAAVAQVTAGVAAAQPFGCE